MADRSYLSIGEVLSLLRDEFPDITISKIRFLESQGLLDPERTPSGYRKFYAADVERLRWILRQQRENFLPLKVIKGRLAEPAGGGVTELTEEVTASVATSVVTAHVVASPAPAPPTAPASSRPAPQFAPQPTATARPAPQGDGQTAAPPAASTPAASSTPATRPKADAEADPDADVLTAGPSAITMTFEELCAAAELPPERLEELEKFGLLAGRSVAGGVYYDEEAFLVAKLAAGFHRYGVEARHLRTYKNAAEREAGLFEQVVMPLVKQRNPAARRQAVDSLAELARLGQGLRGAMLRQALRDYTSS